MFKKSMVINAPEYANDYPVWVASRDDDGQLWFYGAYSSMTEAVDTAMEINGYTCR